MVTRWDLQDKVRRPRPRESGRKIEVGEHLHATTQWQHYRPREAAELGYRDVLRSAASEQRRGKSHGAS